MTKSDKKTERQYFTLANLRLVGQLAKQFGGLRKLLAAVQLLHELERPPRKRMRSS